MYLDVVRLILLSNSAPVSNPFSQEKERADEQHFYRHCYKIVGSQHSVKELQRRTRCRGEMMMDTRQYRHRRDEIGSTYGPEQRRSVRRSPVGTKKIQKKMGHVRKETHHKYHCKRLTPTGIDPSGAQTNQKRKAETMGNSLMK